MRLKYIDVTKGICMLLIIWGHTVWYRDPGAQWCSSFKVTAFYIITGYLLSLRMKDGEKRKLPFKKLFKSTGIPYAFYSFAALVLSTVLMVVRHEEMSFITGKLIDTLTLSGISTLWFLPSMFFGRVIFEGVYLRSGTLFKAALFVLALTLPIVLPDIGYPLFSKSLIGFWFMVVGFEAGKRKDALTEKKPLFVFAVVAAFAVNAVLSFINTGVDFNNAVLGKYPPLFFVTGVLGSLSLMGLVYLIGEKIKLSFVGFVGKNSLFYMCTHMPLYMLSMVMFVIKRLIPVSGMEGYYLKVTAAFFVTMLFLSLGVKLKLRLSDCDGAVGRFMRYI